MYTQINGIHRSRSRSTVHRARSSQNWRIQNSTGADPLCSRSRGALDPASLLCGPCLQSFVPDRPLCRCIIEYLAASQGASTAVVWAPFLMRCCDGQMFISACQIAQGKQSDFHDAAFVCVSQSFKLLFMFFLKYLLSSSCFAIQYEVYEDANHNNWSRPVEMIWKTCYGHLKFILDDRVKMYTSTPNANSSVARRGSERVVREGEGLSTT